MSAPALPEAVLRQRVVAVARRMSADSAPRLAATLFRSGLTVLEITVEGRDGMAAIASLRDSGMTVAAGTVTSIAEAAAAVDAGASFLVSPHLDLELAGWAQQRAIPYVPGCFTPTEIYTAWRAGVGAVKVFPASMGGPGLIEAIRGPFPEIPLVPTGGVTADDAAAYLRAGAVALGVGGWLTRHSDLDLVAQRAAQLVQAIGLV